MILELPSEIFIIFFSSFIYKTKNPKRNLSFPRDIHYYPLYPSIYHTGFSKALTSHTHHQELGRVTLVDGPPVPPPPPDRFAYSQFLLYLNFTTWNSPKLVVHILFLHPSLEHLIQFDIK